MPFLTVEPFVYLCMTGFFLSIVSTPQLILENRCIKHFSESKCRGMYEGHSKSDYNKIQEDAAMWIGVYKVIANFVTFLALPTIGTLADVFGRHRAMFLVPLSLLFRSSFMLLLLRDGKDFSTWIILLVGPIPGFVGGFGGLIVFATSYISDITPYEQRTLRITLIDAAVVLAGFTATLISGFIIEKFGYFGIYIAVIALVSLALMDWLFFIKPETKHLQGIQKQSKGSFKVTNFVCDDSVANLMVTCSDFESSCKRQRIVGELNRSFFKSLQDFEETIAMDSEIKQVITLTDSIETNSSETLGQKTAKEKNIENHSTIEIVSYNSECEDELDSEIFDEIATEILETEEETTQNTIDMTKTKDSITTEISVKSTQTGRNQVLKNAKTKRLKTTRALTKIEAAENTRRARAAQTGQRDRPYKSLLMMKLKDAANPFKSFARIIHAVKGAENKRLQMTLLVVMAFNTLSNTGELNVIVIFLRNEPFYMSPRNVGFLMAFQYGAVAIIGLILFNMIFQRLCRLDDLVMILVSSTLSTAYFISMGLARSVTMLYVIQSLHAICTLSTPAIRAFMSKMSKPSTVGAIMGLTSMVETFSSVISCFAAPITYAKLASISTGAVFYIFALFMLIASVIAIVLNITYPRNQRDRTIDLGVSNESRLLGSPHTKKTEKQEKDERNLIDI